MRSTASGPDAVLAKTPLFGGLLGREKPHHTIQGRPEVVTVTLFGFAGVKRHPHPHPAALVPGSEKTTLCAESAASSAFGAESKAAQQASPTILKT